MANTSSFLTLEQIFNMFTPVDLVGSVNPTLGAQDISQSNTSVARLLSLLENSGRGVLSINDFITAAKQLQINASGNAITNAPLSSYLAIWTDTTGPTPSGAQNVSASPAAGTLVSSITPIYGTFTQPTRPRATSNAASIIVSRTPFFHPANCNTKRAEIFMNSMPNVVLAQIVPYMQVDFEFSRSGATATSLSQLSALKLLLGSVDVPTLSAPNAALYTSHEMSGLSTAASGLPNQQKAALDYAGMEMFTSPVTMTNPLPNLNASGRPRFTDVLDPYRPFATVDHITIQNHYVAGIVKTKSGTITLKVHDRSRLNEIADLIRPAQAASTVTIWLTYGWRAPTRGDQTLNPYFAYVNDNMMMREAFQVKNASYQFDPKGQVTITLQIYTRCIDHFMSLKLSDNGDSASLNLNKIHKLTEDISELRVKLGLDKPSGTSKEIRPFQRLDPGTSPQFMNFKKAQTQINALEIQLRNTPSADQTAATALIAALTNLYTIEASVSTSAGSTKFDLNSSINALAKTAVANMFKDVGVNGTATSDPFLPSNGSCPNDQLVGLVKAQTGKNLVSLGKMLTVFMLRHLVCMDDIDEVQFFFYNFNAQCGPLSNCNLAEFPVDMNAFHDTYVDETTRTKCEDMLVSDFWGLLKAHVENLQHFAYGMKSPAAVASTANAQSTKNGAQASTESSQSAAGVINGVICKPDIDLEFEVAHQRTSIEGQSDILMQLNYSPTAGAAGSAIPVPTASDQRSFSTVKILRVHVLDRSLNVREIQGQLANNVNKTGRGTTGVQQSQAASGAPVNASPFAAIATAVNSISSIGGAVITQNPADNTMSIDTTTLESMQKLKDLASKTSPTIRFGTSGTTIKSAILTTMENKKVSATLMSRAATSNNTTGGNGSDQPGLPIWVIPASLSLVTLGNPLARIQQQYFIDFQTGTTLDSIYICHDVLHTFTPGKFETAWKFSFQEGLARYIAPSVDIAAATATNSNTGATTPVAPTAAPGAASPQ